MTSLKMTMNKKLLSPEEKALFAEAVKNMKPPPRKKQFFSNALEYSLMDLEDLPAYAWVNSEEIITFSRTKGQNVFFKKIAQGTLPIEARLDLHQMTVSNALAQTQQFLDYCCQQNIRCALIIHGKGKNPNKPILKNALNQWLRIHESVLAFHTAAPRHGGGGALYIRLR